MLVVELRVHFEEDFRIGGGLVLGARLADQDQPQPPRHQQPRQMPQDIVVAAGGLGRAIHPGDHGCDHLLRRGVVLQAVQEAQGVVGVGKTLGHRAPVRRQHGVAQGVGARGAAAALGAGRPPMRQGKPPHPSQDRAVAQVVRRVERGGFGRHHVGEFGLPGFLAGVRVAHVPPTGIGAQWIAGGSAPRPHTPSLLQARAIPARSISQAAPRLLSLLR